MEILDISVSHFGRRRTRSNSSSLSSASGGACSVEDLDECLSTSTAASDETCQQNFQKIMGELSTDTEVFINTSKMYVTDAKAELLCLALQHKDYSKELQELSFSHGLLDLASKDTSLTKTQYAKFRLLKSQIIINVMKGNDVTRSSPEVEALTQFLEEGCCCELHTASHAVPKGETDPYLVLVEDIIETPARVTDFYGFRIMKVISFILASNGHDISVEQVSPGSPYAIEYQIVAAKPGIRTRNSHQTFKFRGYPDFVLRSQHRRRQSDVHRIQAVGETQSKTGVSHVQSAVAQAGIYATGLLVASEKTFPKRKLVTVVLTKQKGGLVLVTTKNGLTLTHKRVGSCDPYNLKDVSQLRTFIQVIGSSLEWQAQ